MVIRRNSSASGSGLAIYFKRAATYVFGPSRLASNTVVPPPMKGAAITPRKSCARQYDDDNGSSPLNSASSKLRNSVPGRWANHW